MTRATAPARGNGVFDYDDANQLTSESNSGYSASYTYDANGNRASQTLNGTTYDYTNDNVEDPAAPGRGRQADDGESRGDDRQEFRLRRGR